MNLVKNHQFAFVISQVTNRIRQLYPVGLILKVQIDRRLFFSDLQGKRRLADLTRIQQDNRRGMCEQVIEARAEAS